MQTEEQSVAADLAALSLGNLPDDDYRQRFLQRLNTYLAAKTSGFWVCNDQETSGFTLVCQVNQTPQAKQLLFGPEARPATRLCVKRAMQPFKRYLIEPGAPIAKGSDKRNPTDHWWFFQSAQFHGKLIGVFGFALPPKTDPHDVVRRAPVMDHLGQLLYTHMVVRKKGGKELAAANLQKLLHYANGLVGELDKEELAIYLVNQTRDVIGCERVSLFERRGGDWKALAVSGNHHVDQQSNLAKALAGIAQVTGETKGDDNTPSRLLIAPEQSKAASAAPEVEPAEQQSAVALRPEEGALASLREVARTEAVLAKHVEDGETGTRFCVLFESAERLFFGEAEEPEEPAAGQPSSGGAAQPALPEASGTPTRTLADWMVETAKRALFASHTHHTLPFRPLLAKVSRLFGEKERDRTRRRLTITGLILITITLFLLIPVDQKAIGLCRLLPANRDAVVAESTGRILEVKVTEGESVAAGDLLGRFDTTAYETEAEIAGQRRLKAETDMRLHQSNQEMTEYHIAQLAAEQAGHQKRHFEEMIRRSQFRAPIEGVVLTKDIHQAVGQVLQTGDVFCEVAALDDWELQIEIDEADYSLLTQALQEHGSLEVAYILSANSSLTLQTTLKDLSSISQMAFASQDKNIFFVTIPNITLPTELQGKIRPGFSGTARINIGKSPLIVVTFRKFVHFLRMRWML